MFCVTFLMMHSIYAHQAHGHAPMRNTAYSKMAVICCDNQVCGRTTSVLSVFAICHARSEMEFAMQTIFCGRQYI